MTDPSGLLIKYTADFIGAINEKDKNGAPTQFASDWKKYKSTALGKGQLSLMRADKDTTYTFHYDPELLGIGDQAAAYTYVSSETPAGSDWDAIGVEMVFGPTGSNITFLHEGMHAMLFGRDNEFAAAWAGRKAGFHKEEVYAIQNVVDILDYGKFTDPNNPSRMITSHLLSPYLQHGTPYPIAQGVWSEGGNVRAQSGGWLAGYLNRQRGLSHLSPSPEDEALSHYGEHIFALVEGIYSSAWRR